MQIHIYGYGSSNDSKIHIIGTHVSIFCMMIDITDICDMKHALLIPLVVI